MNQDVKSRIEQYTYWNIFEEGVNRRTDREILTDIERLMTNVVDEVTARAGKMEKMSHRSDPTSQKITSKHWSPKGCHRTHVTP